MKIPLWKVRIGKRERESIDEVLRSGKFARGKQIEKFENEFSKYVEKKYAITVNSGTSGLHVAVRSLGWQKGDEIITTPFSYIASGNALLFENVTPVFVDIDPNTLTIDVSKIEKRITSKTKGILIIDVFGCCCDQKELMRLKNKYNLKIIEDACEAVGRPTNSFPVGRCADITVFGFHENKQMTTLGEGGMLTTNDRRIAQKCRSLRDQGRSMLRNWIPNVILGFNFRMTEIQAAFGLTQLNILDTMLERRQKLAQKYYQNLGHCKNIAVPHSAPRSWFQYFIICKSTEERERLFKNLEKHGIHSSKNYFPLISNFPMYEKYRKGTYPIAEQISKTLLVLPMFFEMTESQVQHVSNVIKRTFRC